jgi:hypothetical protein
MEKKEHWAKKLKRELAEEKAKVRELVLRPESIKSVMISSLVKIEDGIERRVWFGSYGLTKEKTTGGLLHQMTK